MGGVPVPGARAPARGRRRRRGGRGGLLIEPARIRAATAEDAEAIAQVHIRTWQVAYAHLFSADALDGLASALDSRADFWRGVMNSGGSVLVAEDDERVVGFASIGPTLDRDLDATRIGELYAIYVLPEMSGKGVGRALMAELLERLRQERFDEATLWVLEDNPRTRAFYELAGWRLDGAVKDDSFFETPVREVRYRIALRD